MEPLNFSNINFINNPPKIGNKPEITKKDIPISNSKEISQEAANALRNQVLYQKREPNFVEYLEPDLTAKEIITRLKDKDTMGRSFFGNKKWIAKIITTANDPELAVKNFNILMNAKDKKINATDIRSILSVSVSVNNDKNSQIAEKYGFKGGTLTDKDIDSIMAVLVKVRQEQAMEQAAVNQYNMQLQMMNQQAAYQQQMFNQQLVEQSIMQTTPGFGFC